MCVVEEIQILQIIVSLVWKMNQKLKKSMKESAVKTIETETTNALVYEWNIILSKRKKLTLAKYCQFKLPEQFEECRSKRNRICSQIIQMKKEYWENFLRIWSLMVAKRKYWTC